MSDMTPQEWRIRRDIEAALWTLDLAVTASCAIVIIALTPGSTGWLLVTPLGLSFLLAAYRLAVLPPKAPLPKRCPPDSTREVTR